jgi:hypothetical protein
MTDLNFNQQQVSQVVQALWGIAHAFQYVAEAIFVGAIIRALCNK